MPKMYGHDDVPEGYCLALLSSGRVFFGPLQDVPLRDIEDAKIYLHPSDFEQFWQFKNRKIH